jgi:Concanavalin A-like lectin/glucanases superfamily
MTCKLIRPISLWMVLLMTQLSNENYVLAQATPPGLDPTQGANSTQGSDYDAAILADQPVLYLTMGAASDQGVEPDQAGSHLDGQYRPDNAVPPTIAMPNGDLARHFDGASQYLEVPSSAALSVPTTGTLSIEAWMAPDTLQFEHEEGSGYVYWLGKGDHGEYEYAMRMYSLTNTETPPRPNRISGYAFNPAGGLGSGSYFQDPVVPGQWIHVVLVINTIAISPQFPTGFVTITKNGVARKTTALDQFGVVPVAGSAPFRAGTLNLRSFFAGSIGKVAVYDYELTREQILTHTHAMLGGK